MGNYLPNPNLQRKSQRLQKDNLDIVVTSMQGWRADMEDAHLCVMDLFPGLHLFGIFDGHGGPEVAKYVSQYLPQMLKENEEFEKGNHKKGIIQCFRQLDEQMLKDDCLALKPYQRFPSEKSSAGCTAVLLILHKNGYLIANLGDSRIISFHKDQQVQNYDTEHKPDFPQEQERIIAGGGKVVKGRINWKLNLSRALGDFNFKQNPTLPYHKQMVSCVPTFFEGDLDNNFEFFLLGCDGLWETKSDEKICNFLIKEINSPVKQCESLLEFVVSKNLESKKGKDNMSLILVRFKF